MANAEWVKPGQRVCITGHGTSGGVHEHTIIARLTTTQIVCENSRKFRRDETLSSIPVSGYSYFRINPACQKAVR